MNIGGENSFKAKVMDVYYRGNVIQCKMLFNGEIEFLFESNRRLQINDEINIEIEKHIFFNDSPLL